MRMINSFGCTLGRCCNEVVLWGRRLIEGHGRKGIIMPLRLHKKIKEMWTCNSNSNPILHPLRVTMSTLLDDSGATAGLAEQKSVPDTCGPMTGAPDVIIVVVLLPSTFGRLCELFLLLSFVPLLHVHHSSCVFLNVRVGIDDVHLLFNLRHLFFPTL